MTGRHRRLLPCTSYRALRRHYSLQLKRLQLLPGAFALTLCGRHAMDQQLLDWLHNRHNRLFLGAQPPPPVIEDLAVCGTCERIAGQRALTLPIPERAR